MEVRKLIDQLDVEKHLSCREWIYLWQNYSDADRLYAAELAVKIARTHYGKNIFVRGIVEFANYCSNDCFYCGIRRSNHKVQRYSLSNEQIKACCHSGWENGIRTFVLQSGEAGQLDLERLCNLVRELKSDFPECAVTLSLGELAFAEYQALRQAGADRYLLRHESANSEHYRKMHPEYMSLQHRLECLDMLKTLGYQTGCGIMTGSPFQTAESLADDMLFMEKFQPQMVGIGPFIPHCDTPFGQYPAGSLELTLMALSLCRIMLPEVLLPATTALGTLQQDGRILGILAGANVIMPNLTPPAVQNNYNLYNNKIHTDDGVRKFMQQLHEQLKQIDYTAVVGRGDFGDKIC